MPLKRPSSSGVLSSSLRRTTLGNISSSSHAQRQEPESEDFFSNSADEEIIALHKLPKHSSQSGKKTHNDGSFFCKTIKEAGLILCTGDVANILSEFICLMIESQKYLFIYFSFYVSTICT